MAVVAVFGIQMIEPFHAVTISKESSHKSLQIFFKDLYRKLITPITEDFFSFKKPWYPGISDSLFKGVKKGYKPYIIESVQEYVMEHIEEAMKLANFFKGIWQSHLQDRGEILVCPRSLRLNFLWRI